MLIWTAEDRSLAVPPEAIIKTARVEMHRIKLACKAPMSTADVEQARQRLLCVGGNDPWPCPVGRWEGSWFSVTDGPSLCAGRADARQGTATRRMDRGTVNMAQIV